MGFLLFQTLSLPSSTLATQIRPQFEMSCELLLPLYEHMFRWLAQLLVNVGFPEPAATLATDIVAPTPLTTS